MNNSKSYDYQQGCLLKIELIDNANLQIRLKSIRLHIVLPLLERQVRIIEGWLIEFYNMEIRFRQIALSSDAKIQIVTESLFHGQLVFDSQIVQFTDEKEIQIESNIVRMLKSVTPSSTTDHELDKQLNVARNRITELENLLQSNLLQLIQEKETECISKNSEIQEMVHELQETINKNNEMAVLLSTTKDELEEARRSAENVKKSQLDAQTELDTLRRATEIGETELNQMMEEMSDLKEEIRQDIVTAEMLEDGSLMEIGTLTLTLQKIIEQVEATERKLGIIIEKKQIFLRQTETGSVPMNVEMG